MPVVIAEQVRFVATQAGAEWVSSGVVLASDLTGIIETPATITNPKPGDKITAYGKTYIILRCEPVAASPDAVLFYTVQARL